MEKKPSLNVVIPVYNEERELEESISTLRSFLARELKRFDWKITIVDNASTDATFSVAKKLEDRRLRIEAIHLDQKGRGRAVKYAWRHDTADMNAYMDVDLSTDLKHLPALVESLGRGYDIAIGSRNARGARVYGRSLLRTITSKGYMLLVKLFFHVHFSDAQCGYKVVTRKVVEDLVPDIVDDEWFFDSELLIVGEKAGYRIYEEPVTWIDNPGSTVRVMSTALGDLQGLWRIFLTRPWRRVHGS